MQLFKPKTVLLQTLFLATLLISLIRMGFSIPLLLNFETKDEHLFYFV
ncbi:hypothetical protein Avbf_14835, partial [Armadillidium vulgare]